MHPQNAMLETSPELCSARPRTGEPSATFGCTEATTPASPFFSVHSINASVGPSPDEATSATWHYQRNQQFSITAVTTSSGSVAERYAYTAYGQPTILDGSGSVLSSSAINNRYTYTGREWDQSLGLYHFRARWMSPKTGRFLTRDPIGYEADDPDLYRFAFGNVLIGLDPSGMEQPWPGYPGPRQPVIPPKPKPGKKRNSKMPFGLPNMCLCGAKPKNQQLTPNTNVEILPPGTVTPGGPSGGENTTYPFPPNPTPQLIGTTGANPCVALIVKCANTVTVFHFEQGDLPDFSLDGIDWSGCTAMVCGGDNSPLSNCLRDLTINAAKNHWIPVQAVSGAESCGVTSNGGWWEK
jgi:RHS repeat-associated protein